MPILNCIHQRVGPSCYNKTCCANCQKRRCVVFCSVHAESNARRGARWSCRPHDSRRAKPPGDKRGQGKAKAAADQWLPVSFARIRFRSFPGQKPGPGFGAAVSYSAVLVTALPAAAMDSSALPNSWNWNRSHRFDAPQHHQERGHQILFALGDYPI
ncbi:hypothetical protein PVAP13_7KG344240 [Panicum virgatum]|uniref:Uncharacterized protein n=1 Tax=Panicum virgatum TaxID=38727 RepID=A0A8T0QMS1_PANVG|nr:hypothetical protein PVAP13_7KG344240 [Panicum virgatum]